MKSNNLYELKLTLHKWRPRRLDILGKESVGYAQIRFFSQNCQTIQSFQSKNLKYYII